MAIEKFNLESFLTDSQCLEVNLNPPTRPMFLNKTQDPFSPLLKEDPLDVLGETKFGPAREVSEDVIGTPIQEFFRGAHVLITGGTGFVGKVLTEKLVRSMPHVGHVYLLIRAKRGASSQQRFEKLLEDKVFSRMKTEVPQYLKKVSVVEGDLSEHKLGLSSADRQLLLVNVNVVFHSAADVRFIEPLKAAIESNVLGSKRVLDLAKEIRNLKSFVYVSTAYSQCVRRVIEENIPKMNINYKEILSYVGKKTDKELEKEYRRLMQGWPNTYTFSKAVCEDMLQEEAKGLPICIFRPSAVYPTYKEPVRGWFDNLYGPLGLFLAIGHGIIHFVHMVDELSLDTVPVDYVVNGMIAAAWKLGQYRQAEEVQVYNFTSTPVKPSCWKDVTRIALKYKDKIPFTRAIWYTTFLYSENFLVNEVAQLFLHKIPGVFFDKLAVFAGEKPMLTKIYNRIDKMRSQLVYFAVGVWHFRNDNVMDLWRVLSKEDKKYFHFDLSDVDTEEHFVVSKLGMRFYFLKDSFETLPAAIKKNNWLYWAHMTLKTVCGLAALKLMVLTAHALPI